MRREQAKSVREHLRERVEREADTIYRAYRESLDAVLPDGSPDFRARYQGATALLAEAYGKPVQRSHEEQAVTFNVVLPDWWLSAQLPNGPRADLELEASEEPVAAPPRSNEDLAAATGLSVDELAETGRKKLLGGP